MLKRTLFYLIPSFLIMTQWSCSDVNTTNPLTQVLASSNPKIKRVMDSVAHYEVQIRYTQIDRKNDTVVFTDYDFQVRDSQYFYPASTVKFPAAVLTLEKLNQLKSTNRKTRFYVEGDSVETSFEKEIYKIFAVSDNAAYNRLFEFLGTDHINKSIAKKGIGPVRISHRLSTQNADDITTNPLVIYMNDSTTRTSTSIINSIPRPLKISNVSKGKAFYASEELIQEPFNFSLKNYYSIAAQHNVLKRVIFPQNFKNSEKFDLSQAQRTMLLKAMHTLPKNLDYDPNVYFDSYGKFLMFGDSKENIPAHIKIFNKVGYAYGTLTDCAYIQDTLNAIEFMVTATILVNNNGVFNDDTYEYDTIGIPFLAQLGRELYELEQKRKK